MPASNSSPDPHASSTPPAPSHSSPPDHGSDGPEQTSGGVVEGEVVDAPTGDRGNEKQADPIQPGNPAATIERLMRTTQRLAFWVGFVSLALLALIVYLPGFFSLPPVDRDESRFAQASRQMLQSGDWVVPMVQDRPRLNKPPMIYWLQAASAGLFTRWRPLFDSIWMYRVPSLLAGVAAVLLTWRVGLAMFDQRTARLSAAMLAVCPVIVWEAHQARADMVLLAFTIATQLALFQLFREHPVPIGRDADTRATWRWTLVFWLSLAAGVLTKGPITPMIAAFTGLGASAITGRWRWWWRTQPLVGLPMLFLFVGPWVYAVVQRVGWDTYWNTIVGETLGRAAGAKENHWGPPGYHLLLLPVLFWPGSLLTAAGIGLAFQTIRRHRSQRRGDVAALPDASTDAVAFCLAWIVPSWLVFELVATKLPHYTMPLLPPIAILSARAVLAIDAGIVPRPEGRLARVGLWLWIALGFALVALLPGLGVVRASKDLGIGWGVVGLGLALLAANYIRIAARHLFQHQRIARAQVAGIGAMILGVWCLVGVLLPRWSDLWITPKIIQTLAQVDPTGDRPVAAVGYHEDSLVFARRGALTRLDEAGVEAWLAANPNGLVIAPAQFSESAPGMRTLARVSGFNYSKGRPQSLVIAEAAR